MNKDILTLLVVEDSEEDFTATRRALRRSGVKLEVQRSKTGDDALDYLYQRKAYAEVPPPDVVLLDLNLPGTDGREVLKQLRSDATWDTLPIIILTTSSALQDIEACYRDGANSYIVKPVDLPAFMTKMATFATYWYDTVTVPSRVQE